MPTILDATSAPRLYLARGATSIAIGLIALLWPGATLTTAAVIFGAYLLADGVLAIAASQYEWRRHGLRNTWNVAMAVIGGIEIACGIAAFLTPSTIALALSILIGVWAFGIGIMEIVGALLVERMHARIPTQTRIYLGLLGAATFALSLALLIVPGWEARGLLWTLSLYGVLAGAIYWDLGRTAMRAGYAKPIVYRPEVALPTASAAPKVRPKRAA